MKRKAAFATWISLITLLLVWSSCGMQANEYQKQVPIPNAKWNAAFMPEFDLDITDTTSPTKYAWYLIFRHDDSYPNSNIWFRLNVQEPGSKKWITGPRMEVDLANSAGQWLGRGTGSIWEHKIRLDAKGVPQFNKAGVYHIKIEQLMRYKALPAVLNVGIRVERWHDSAK
jgi:gliding motility-associated lipoprotein GldH